MRRFSLASGYRTILFPAFVAAHLVKWPVGFRLKDVQFYCELNANWLGLTTAEQKPFEVALVQIKRLIDTGLSQNLVEATKQSKHPTWTLTLGGLEFLLESLTDVGEVLPPEETVFVMYFLSAYTKAITQHADENFFRQSDLGRKELCSLLNEKAFLNSQMQLVETKIQDLKKRVQENEEIADYLDSSGADGTDFSHRLKYVTERYGYQLSHRKPMGELITELPERILKSEFQEGIRIRNALLFKKNLSLQMQILNFLRSL